MNYGLTAKPSFSASECLVLGIFSDKELSEHAQTLDKNIKVLLIKPAKKASETVILYGKPI